jgi:hypothetical protein
MDVFSIRRECKGLTVSLTNNQQSEGSFDQVENYIIIILPSYKTVGRRVEKDAEKMPRGFLASTILEPDFQNQ